MSKADEKLDNIKKQLDNGIAPQRETVRAFLLWFGASRRGLRVCSSIRAKLKKFGIKTKPDFEYAYIGQNIEFIQADSEEQSSLGTAATDPTYRIGRLEAANSKPVSVTPDEKLTAAVSLMLIKDFSQLPVMTSARDVKGIISWKTIGSRLALKKSCEFVRDAMEPAQEVGIDDSLFSAISLIAEHDYVIVRAHDREICGIITASDFNLQFQKLAEPFLLVGEIENGIRQILHGKFNQSELEEAKAPGDDGREISGVSDLTFGEYIHLIESQKGWGKLKVNVDRKQFVKELDGVRGIRNDVMHFDPDGLEESDLHSLREFAHFLKRLRDVGAV